jgi:putative RecB family exonuclease
VAARRTLRLRSRRVELHHLPTGTIAAYVHTEESLERHLGRAESIATEASAADRAWREGLAARLDDASVGDADAIEAIDAALPPRPGPGCSWCDYRRWCLSGREASVELAPWDGLADLD